MHKIFIDNNVWDVLYANKIDLAKELPIEEFEICITREAEFEFSGMPHELLSYVKKTMEERNIKTETRFGFYDPKISKEAQRNAGFGTITDSTIGGRMIGLKEYQYLENEKKRIGKSIRPTGLYKNEADVSLSAKALIDFVISSDGKKSLGKVKSDGIGNLIDLKKYKTGTSFSEFVKSEIESIKRKNG